MNKNRYRIIFSKAKNMFIAVAENIKSQSKATGQSTHSVSITESVDSKSFHQLWQVKSIVASMSLFMAFSPVYAQMQADPNAAASQRASIGVGKNQQGQNVPVVNIQTPKNGVSHNVYNQFDVLQPGVVLNNSRNGAGSVIVGQVGANPYLQTGEARVILNEVNSSAASQFRGNLEIAGQRADVIIANPSGINIQGGGFINANKAIFTTGKPQLNADGSIKQFVVNQGKVNVNSTANNLGLGGNNNNADYVDIYAKAVELNAQVHANQALQLITGSSTISEDSTSITPNQANSTTPTFALDVKALGGMYANNIFIIGTDKGLGVSNVGTIQALNNLVITSSGQIVNSGLISSTSKTQGLLSIKTTETGTAGDINTSGNISSNTLINIDSGNNLNLNANQIILNNGGVASSPLLINTQGNLNLASNTRIMNDSSNADLYIDAANINLATNSEIRSNRGSADINIKNNLIAAQNAGLVVSYDLNIAAGNKQELKGSILQATVGTINLKAGSNNSKGLINIQDGTVWAGTNLNLNSSGDIAIKNMGLVADNAVSKVKNINAYSDQNLTWEHTGTALAQISGKVQLDAANQLNLLNGTLSAKDDISLQGNQLVLGSALTSDKSISITSKVGDLTLSHALTANGNINASADKGSLTTSGLKATSNGGKLSLMAGKNVTLTHAGLTRSVLLGAQGVNVASVGDGNVTSLSTDLYSSQGNVLVSSNLRNTLTDTTLNATKNIEVFAKDNLTLDGVITLGRAHTALNSQKNIYINSIAGAADTPVFSSAKSSQFTSTGSLSVTSGADINVQNAKLTGGAVLVEAGGGFNPNTAVELNATGSDLLKNDTKINSINGDLSVQTNKTLNIDPKKITLKATGDIELVSKAGDLNLLGYGGAAGNGSEQVVKLNTSNGGVSLEGKNINIEGAQINSNNDIKIISSDGNILVDGVKNTFNNYKVVKIINDLNNTKAILDSKQKSLFQDPTYKFINDNYGVWVEGTIDPQVLSNAKKHLESLYDVKVYIDKQYSSFKKQWRYFVDISNKYPNKIKDLDEDLNFYKDNLSGYMHQGVNLKSNVGKIDIISNKGTQITGAEIVASNGIVNIEARGPLPQIYTSTTLDKDGKAKKIGASIIIDGLADFYDRGKDTDADYSVRRLISPTVINGSTGVNIKAVGNSFNDNLVLQATGVVSQNGDVSIQANKNILFDAAVETNYDRSTKTEKRKSWGGLKKKYITTRVENEEANAASVEIIGKNIKVESKEQNQNNSIDIYSGKFIADGGKISIRSGGKLNFYTVQESSSSQTDVTKKSSFAGIKIGNSKTSTSREILSELPTKLKADYIGAKSGYDMRLEGTEFQYLKEATLESGGKIELFPAITKITEITKKEKSSVVWQSMQDKGSVTETGTLPSFNGPTPPLFNAAGGITVQIPVGERDQNKVQIRDEILRLANQPGNQYLKDFVHRNDVDWNKIILAQKGWDYKSQGLTGAAAAIIVIIVAIVTYGAGTAAAAGTAAGGTAAGGGTTVGLGASMIGTAGITTTTTAGVTTIGVSTLGTMANAAVASIATQTSISLINNGGDVAATFKELGSKESIKNLATSVVTAGVISQLGNVDIMKDLGNMTKSSDFIVDIAGRTGMALINSGVSAAINTGINGGSLSENLEAALLNGLASSLQGSLSEQVGLEFDIENKTLVDEILHKVAHIASGCVAGAIQQQCEAGAIGAGVGEIVAGYFDKPVDTASQQEKDAFRTKVLATTKVVSGTVAALTGYDVNTAATSAESAINNNYLTSQQVKNFHKEASDCKSNQACLKNVDNKYFGKTVYDNQGNVISGFYGANQEAFRNCNTTECRIQHGTALIAGQLAYNELNQDSINPNLWIKAKSYITNGGVYSYVGDKDQTYVNGVSQVLGFIEAKCGGALNEACQAKWIERNNQQKSAFLTLGGLLLSPAILKTVSYSASTLRGCLVSPTCSTNLKLTIDAAITDGSIYGAGATAVTLPSKQILQKESSKLGSIIANAFRLETPNASLGLCFSGKECFVAGTLVETDQGLKPIEKFIGSELVWSRDDITLEYGYKPVIGLSRTENQPIYEVVISHPNGKNETFETTQEHPFWVKDIGWLKASLLKSGMVVYDRNNKPLTIVNQVLLAKVDTVYNIEVEDTHTYHVGELGVWVHNACCNVDSLKFTLQKLHSNGDNPLLKNGSKQINQISNNLMKDPDIESLFRIINLPQIQNAKGAANLMSAYYSSSLRPSVIQALNYADDIVKSNPKAIIEFEAKRINGSPGTTDIIVKNAQGAITHAIELKSLDVISPPNVKDNNLVRNISNGIEQLKSSQSANIKIVAVELKNSYSNVLTPTLKTDIQKLKNLNPNINIHVQFADGVNNKW